MTYFKIMNQNNVVNNEQRIQNIPLIAPSILLKQTEC